jgi:hypothetical protein
VLGLVLVLTGAYFYPLPTNVRLRSDIEPVANGGRKEDFYINLEFDRVAPAQEVLTASFPEKALDSGGDQVVRAELFRVRNTQREVIGLASRMTGLVPAADGESSVAINWLVLIPGRGALLLSQGPSLPIGLLPESAQFKQGKMLVGDGEFSALSGSYVEATLAEDSNGDGVDEAVLLLSTRLASGDTA